MSGYPDYSPTVLRSLRIVATFFHSLAITTSIYRIVHKIRTSRFWWDDGFVGLATLLDAMLLSTIWIRRWNLDHIQATGHTHLTLRIAISWTESMSYSSILWLSRIAILTSTIRLLQPGRLRRVTIATCYAFAVAWFAICGHKAYMCSRDNEWHYEWRVDCRLGTEYTVIKIVTDVLSCTLLIGLPLRMLWNTSLPKFERWMIRVVFTSSLLSTAISAVHDAYLVGSNRILEGYTGHIEAAITLSVSNLLIITTRTYRCIRRLREWHAARQQSSSSSSSTSTSSPTSSPPTQSHHISLTLSPRASRSRRPTSQRRRRDITEGETQGGGTVETDHLSFTQLDTLDLFPSTDTNTPRVVGSVGSTFDLGSRRDRGGGRRGSVSESDYGSVVKDTKEGCKEGGEEEDVADGLPKFGKETGGEEERGKEEKEEEKEKVVDPDVFLRRIRPP